MNMVGSRNEVMAVLQDWIIAYVIENWPYLCCQLTHIHRDMDKHVYFRENHAKPMPYSFDIFMPHNFRIEVYA